MTEKPPATTTVELTDPQRDLIYEALDALVYHQVSEPAYRSKGYVNAPGADDKDTQALLMQIDKLAVLIGGDPVTNERIAVTNEIDDEDDDEDDEAPDTLCANLDCDNDAVDENSYCEDHMADGAPESVTRTCITIGCEKNAVKNARCDKHQPAQVFDASKITVKVDGVELEGIENVRFTPVIPDDCARGKHDFEIGPGFRQCNLCEAQEPFPNTRDGLLAFLESETQRMLKIARAKNQDYAGEGAKDPFANFTRVEALGICTPEVGFLTRMSDKLSRIASITASGKTAVKDESVKDTLRDLANYSLLMLAYLASKEEGAL